MYNHGTGPGMGGSGLLSLPLPQGENSTTPRTPEILNSLIAMTNPFDSQYRAHAPRLASSPPGGSDTSTSSSGSPGCMSPPSVQHTCSQLIKEGLKLTLQSKRRQGCSSLADDDPLKNPNTDEVCPLGDDDDPFSPGGLTPEDEERRRRRRERNKIAATKCRLKKRERTVNLVQESEILENQNHDLKTQIQELETQRRRLVEMLNVHGPSCTKLPDTFPAPTASVASSYPSSSYQSYPRGGFRRVNTFPRASTSTLTYRRVELTSVETYQTPADNYAYHSPPTYSEPYPCQTVTSEFVKPELPSMGSFHSPSPAYQLPGLAVSPGYDSPHLAAASAYTHYDEESDTFSSGFSPTSLDGSCISGN